mmetsp:Transcript_76272/g.215876  ORF Transcript_76272/g.215876 Transcript_76272/m.215876 type:complete len:303 (+) Transcript_76272:34-942(+)
MGLLESTHELFAFWEYGKRFKIHRAWGLVYLVQFAAAAYLEVLAKPEHTLVWTLPLTGVIQSIIATRTFTFLPKASLMKKRAEGFFNETHAMSYDFVFENVYFALLLFWQSAYLCFAKEIRGNRFLLPVEILMNFFPYYTIRHFFPKTQFRNSTDSKKAFERIYAKVVKTFYVAAKHFQGYYVNYLNFLGLLGSNPAMEHRMIRYLLLLGGWGTTISIFLQTLKFRKYISLPTNAILYAGSFPFFYLGYAALIFQAADHLRLTMLVAFGAVVNYFPRSAQILWQGLMCTILVSHRCGLIDLL